MRRSLLLFAFMLLPGVAFAQMSQVTRTGTIAAGGGSVEISTIPGDSTFVLNGEPWSTVKIQTLDTYTGVWEVQCSVDGVTYDTGNELKLSLADSSTTVVEVDSVVGTWDVQNATACRKIKVVSTSGFAATNVTLAITASQAGGGGAGGAGGGGAGGAVTITDGTDTALVSAGGELIVSCADCSGSGVSHIDDAAFTPAVTDLVPVAGFFNDSTPDSVNEGDAGVVRMSANRNLYSTIRDAAGNERGALVTANNELLVELGAGAASIGTLGANSGVDIGDVTLTASTNDIGDVDLELNGTAVSTGVGASGTGTIRTATLIHDGTDTALVSAAGELSVAGAVTVTSGTVNATVTSITAGDTDIGNVDLEIAGTGVSTGVGASGAQTLRVASLIHDGTDTVQVTSTSGGALQVECVGGTCSSAGATAYDHGEAITLASVNSLTGGGRVSASAPDTTGVADDDFAVFWVKNTGALVTETVSYDSTADAEKVLFVDTTGTAVAFVDAITFDVDSGAGTQTGEGIGILCPASGGAVLCGQGDATNGLLVNLGANNDVTVTGLGNVEDSAAGSAFTGYAMLAVRQDSFSALAADGDFYPTTIDGTDGGVKVHITNGGSGGTALADDNDFTDGTTSGTPIGGVAEVASPSTVTEGDFGWAAITLNRALKVSMYAVDGTALTPATDWTVGTAIGTTGPGIQAVYADFDGAAIPTIANVNTEGEAVPISASIKGVQYVMVVNEDGSLERGTATTPTVVADAGGGALNVICDSGCAGGTQYAEDLAHTTADVGTIALAVRRDTAASSSATDGDYVTLNTDSTGRLWVNSGLTVAAALADNTANPTAGGGAAYMMCFDGSTWDRCTISTGGSGTIDANTTRVVIATDDAVNDALVKLDAALVVEDAGETAAANLIGVGAVRRDTAASSAATTGDNATINTDSIGRLWVTGTLIEDVAETAGTQLAMAGSVRRDTAASSADTTGDNATINTDSVGKLWVTGTVLEDVAEADGMQLSPMGAVVRAATSTVPAGSSATASDNATVNVDVAGLLWTRTVDPCSGGAKSYYSFDITSATTTEVTPSLSGASTYYYICAINIVTSLANNINLVDDNTDGCGSVTASLVSTGLAAGDGWNFAANGGIAYGNGAASVMKAVTANSVLCLVTSAAGETHGVITVASGL